MPLADVPSTALIVSVESVVVALVTFVTSSGATLPAPLTRRSAPVSSIPLSSILAVRSSSTVSVSLSPSAPEIAASTMPYIFFSPDVSDPFVSITALGASPVIKSSGIPSAFATCVEVWLIVLVVMSVASLVSPFLTPSFLAAISVIGLTLSSILPSPIVVMARRGELKLVPVRVLSSI